MKSILTLSGLLLLTPAAWGQSSLEPPDLERYLRWGAVRARPGLELSDIGYDSNILYARGDEPELSDFTATVSPKLDGLVLFGDRAFLTFLGKLDATLYAKYFDQSFLDYLGEGRVTLPLKNKKLGFFSDFRLREINERPVDLEDTRPVRNDQDLFFGVIFQPGWRSELELAYGTAEVRYHDADYDGPEISSPSLRLDRDETSLTFKGKYRVRGRTRILFDALVSNVDFTNTVEIDGDPLARRTRVKSVMAGLDFGRGGPLTGWFEAGWAKADAEDPRLADYSDPVGKAQIAYRIDSRTSLSLLARRQLYFSVYEFNAFYLYTRAELRAVRYINRLFGVEGAVGQGRLSFPESEIGVGRVDDLLTYDVGVRLRMFQNDMGRRVEYSVRIGRYHRDSSVPSFDTQRTVFGINAVIGY